MELIGAVLPLLLMPVGTPAQAFSTQPASAMVADACDAIGRDVAGRTKDEAAAIMQREDWPALCHYAAANAARRGPAGLVLIGDSLTEGWQKAQPDFFAGEIVGRGISGQTTPQILLRFMADVVALKPRTVHILAGTNDIAGNTGPTTPGAIERNIAAMVTLARANGITALIGSLLPADRFWWRPEERPAAAIATFNRRLRDYAAAQGLTYVDYYNAMATPDGAMRPGLSDDGVHPNAAGYAVMRRVLETALDRRAEGAPPPR